MINVIMHVVTSVETNVKWNGARLDYIRPHRGFYRGDPISPYSFVLCLDKLFHFILHTVDSGDWKALVPLVSHLMFVNDLLLFGEATQVRTNCVTRILQLFRKMSGQEVMWGNYRVCILKSGWKLKSRTNDFWCEVMWGNYRRTAMFEETIMKPTDSSLWKAIVNCGLF